MNVYTWVKTFHLLFVMAWVASAFYLPRILINLEESGGQVDVQTRLRRMGRKLYLFGHVMFGLAVILGLTLWLHFGMGKGMGWIHVKLLLVVLLLAHFIVAGRWLKGLDKGRLLPSTFKLKVFNEVPVLLLLSVIWLVLAKPF